MLGSLKSITAMSFEAFFPFCLHWPDICWKFKTACQIYIFSAINNVIRSHTFIRLNKGHEVIGSGWMCDKLLPEGLWKRINLNTTDWAQRTGNIMFAHIFDRYSWHFLLTATGGGSTVTFSSKKKKEKASFDPPGCCRSGSYLKWTQRTNLPHLITVRWKASENWKK